MRKLAWIAAASAVLALVAVLALAGVSYWGTAHANPGTVTFDLDPDITSNTASVLGPTEACVRCNVDVAKMNDGVADCMVDVIVSGDTVSKPIAYDSSLNYDASKVHVVAWKAKTTLTAGCLAGDPVDCTVADGTIFAGLVGKPIQLGSDSDPNKEVVTLQGVSGNTITVGPVNDHLNGDPVFAQVATNNLIKFPGSPTDLSESLPDSVSPYSAGAYYSAPTASGTAGNGALVRVGLDAIADGVVDFSFGAPPLVAYATLAEPLGTTVNTGTGQLAINTPCPSYADVEIVSQVVKASDCSSDPPTQINAGTDNVLCLRKSIRNNGPITPVDGTITTTLVQTGGGNDCTITPVGGNPATFTGLLLDPPQTKDEKFTVNCTTRCAHSFNFTNTLAVTTVGVTDNVPANNTNIQTAFSTDVIGEADLDVTSVVVAAPASEAVSTAFNVTVTANVTNNGPSTLVTANATLDLTMPAGCTRVPNTTQVAALTNLGSSSPVRTWSVTCTTTGNKTFNGSGSVVVTSEHATDSTPGNNSNTGSDSTDITASADARIQSWVFPDEMTTVAGNQLLVVPGVAEFMTANEALDNNDGTYQDPNPPPDIRVSITLGEVPGANCTAAKAPGFPSAADLPLDGTDVPIGGETWAVNLTSGTACTLGFDKTITITTAEVSDSNLADNTATRSVDLVADTDGDTVPDDYAGLIDNCPDDANPDQADNDDDDIGDVCDPDDDNDGVLDVNDNCVLIANDGQEDADSDGIGNVCELDVNCSGGGPNGADALAILQRILGRVGLDPTQCPAPNGDLYAPRASAYVAYDPAHPELVGTGRDALMILQCILGRNNIVCPLVTAD